MALLIIGGIAMYLLLIMAIVLAIMGFGRYVLAGCAIATVAFVTIVVGNLL